MNSKNYFEILEIGMDASPSDIKRAYYALAKKFHPDALTSHSDAGLFRSIHEAYLCLINPESRKAYILSLVKNSEEADVQFLNTWSSVSKVKLYETFQVFYQFPLNGKRFISNLSPSFVKVGGPYLKKEDIFHENVCIKVTTLWYDVVAIERGALLVSPAQISFNHIAFYSRQIRVESIDTSCYFFKDLSANGQAISLHLSKSWLKNSKYYQSEVTDRKTIFIPCSIKANQLLRNYLFIRTFIGISGLIVGGVLTKLWLLSLIIGYLIGVIVVWILAKQSNIDLPINFSKLEQVNLLIADGYHRKNRMKENNSYGRRINWAMDLLYFTW